MTLVDVRGLSVSYGGTPALVGVDFSIRRGEIVTLVGPNGSGKSSLLRAIIGATEPALGEVLRSPDLKIGYVPQALRIEPTLPITVQRFLDLPRRIGRSKAAVALAEAGIPDLSRRQMSTLSGGQFQRALLARALLGAPDLLILDEPTRGLDQAGSAAFYRKIEETRELHGCAVLMASHELHVVMSASDRVVCLNGHVCCQGAPKAVARAAEYRALFGRGTRGALALYRHDHDHVHDRDLDDERDGDRRPEART